MNFLINKYFFELYLRSFYIIFSFIFSSVIGYISFEELFYLIANPLRSIKFTSQFIYTEVGELFFSSISIGIFFGCIISIPIFLGHVWFFFIPLISTYWRHILKGHIIGILFMIITAILFAYYIIIPLTWNFFFNFEFDSDLLSIRLEAKINQYLYNSIYYILIFIFLFISIYFFFYCIYLNFIKLDTIIYNRLFIFGFNSLIASLISPPDLKIILLIVLLLFVLNEILIIYFTFSKIIPFMKNKRNKLNLKLRFLFITNNK